MHRWKDSTPEEFWTSAVDLVTATPSASPTTTPSGHGEMVSFCSLLKHKGACIHSIHFALHATTNHKPINLFMQFSQVTLVNWEEAEANPVRFQ